MELRISSVWDDCRSTGGAWLFFFDPLPPRFAVVLTSNGLSYLTSELWGGIIPGPPAPPPLERRSLLWCRVPHYATNMDCMKPSFVVSEISEISEIALVPRRQCLAMFSSVLGNPSARTRQGEHTLQQEFTRRARDKHVAGSKRSVSAMDGAELGKIKVCCRIRPLGISDERSSACRTDTGSRESAPIEIEDRRVHLKSGPALVAQSGSGSVAGRLSSGLGGGRRRDRWEFSFDDVLEKGCTQDEAYRRCAKAIVDSVLQGVNGTVMACEWRGRRIERSAMFFLLCPGRHKRWSISLGGAQ